MTLHVKTSFAQCTIHDSIGTIQTRVLSSSHQSFGNYFEGIGHFRLHQLSLSSNEGGYSLCLASKLLLPFSRPHAAGHPRKPGEFPPRCEARTHAESSCVPGGAPSFTVSTLIHCLAAGTGYMGEIFLAPV